MIRMRDVYLIFMCLITSVQLLGQDIHFSQVNRQPIFQNPANSGLFKGDLRFSANYKDQWRSVTVPFSTIALAIDGKWKAKGLNFGGVLFQDQVGDGTFKTIELLGSLSKQLKLTSDSVHSISVGLQAGINYRHVNLDQFYVDNQFNGISFDPNLPTGENFSSDSRINPTVAAGAVYTFLRSKKEQFVFGLSGHNLNKPNQGFYGAKIPRARRLSLFGTYERVLTSDLALLPGFTLNFQGKYREIVLGSQVRYTLINRLGDYKSVNGGVWIRGRDAVILRVGLDIQNWSFGMSYDTNISKLIPASRLRGGLEFSVHYILTRLKPKNIIHRACPDYI